MEDRLTVLMTFIVASSGSPRKPGQVIEEHDYYPFIDHRDEPEAMESGVPYHVVIDRVDDLGTDDLVLPGLGVDGPLRGSRKSTGASRPMHP
jgi:hypothetical protein